ncbi:MAG: pyruvate:ferredoxin (flavodoxin) oxidoreductase [Fimbriimonadales bacterium]|nr:pyruvate:ferredoxin (flavodoxin) oxidoreductase [Fimbriimonadales bacterium]
MKPMQAILDGNEAAADVAYRCSEVIAIYPITPATTMGELADQWNAAGRRNVWGDVPLVREMQSEGGVAGALHGAVQTGALCTSFTSSQGLLLMIPNMYKVAGELTPAVLHVASRAVGSHALTIYVEHSDVMAVRATGWAILFSANVQEAHDLAAIAHAATVRSRVPILHAFDGFRTSHEVAKVQTLSDPLLLELMDAEAILQHRERALNPDRPVIRGTVHNSDVFFQFRERSAPFFRAMPGIVRDTMERFAELTGRRYQLFEYHGHPEAERVIVLMGSGAETAIETAEHLAFLGERGGVVKVRLFQPFDAEALVRSLPPSVRSVAVLDRTKEHGAVGEPLFLAVSAAIVEAWQGGSTPWETPPRIVGGRYGLGGKEFTPAMVKAVFDELAKDRPAQRFTVGIWDDVSGSSLSFDERFAIEKPSVKRAVFWGLGSDGTVSANKNSIAIIGDSTEFHVQGYFLYDSRKSGSITESHLRFGPEPIRSTYLIREASFLGVHHLGIVDVRPVLDRAAEGATVLLNTPFGPEETWNRLPLEFQQSAIAKRVRLFGIDGSRVARELGLGNRISAVMQTAFFALTDILPKEEALQRVRAAVKKAYSKRGRAVVEQNLVAIDRAAESVFPIPVPPHPTTDRRMPAPVSPEAPEFVQRFTGELIAGRGDLLPVSAASEDGSFPLGTTRYEKRNLSYEAPEWDPDLCIQCGKCTLVCPHAVLRAKVFEPASMVRAPEGFKAVGAKWRELPGKLFTIQVSAEDCTGCAVCVDVCPAKDKAAVGRKALQLRPRPEDRRSERERWRFFLELPDVDRDDPNLRFETLKNIQLLPPMFEFSGCCSGCGEAPYVKLMTQLFGDRLLIANAAGCSSVYSSNLPTKP